MRRKDWSEIERLLVLDPVTGCREWQGGLNDKGYGYVKYHRGRWQVHRLVWTYHKGRIPRGRKVCHTCDNPPCGELTHLFLGTSKKNSEDMVAKGRQAKGDRQWTRAHPEWLVRGEQHHKSVLTQRTAERIRTIYRKTNLSRMDIADIFGCGTSTVARVVVNDTYK
jgi:hypothetical protein